MSIVLKRKSLSSLLALCVIWSVMMGAATQRAVCESAQIVPPPVHRPLQYRKIPNRKAGAFPAVPSPGAAPLVRVLHNGQPVRDTIVSGRVRRVSNFLFNLTPEGRTDTFKIGFALPPGFELVIRDTAIYELVVKDSSSLLGANEFVRLLSNEARHLSFLFVWRLQDKSPIEIFSIPDKTTGFRISQQIPTSPLPIIRTEKHERADVVVNYNSQQLKIPVDTLWSFPPKSEQYRVFVRRSSYRYVKDSGSDVRPGFILRALVGEK